MVINYHTTFLQIILWWIKNECTDWSICNDWITEENTLSTECMSKMHGNDTLTMCM